MNMQQEAKPGASEQAYEAVAKPLPPTGAEPAAPPEGDFFAQKRTITQGRVFSRLHHFFWEHLFSKLGWRKN